MNKYLLSSLLVGMLSWNLLVAAEPAWVELKDEEAVAYSIVLKGASLGTFLGFIACLPMVNLDTLLADLPMAGAVIASCGLIGATYATTFADDYIAFQDRIKLRRIYYQDRLILSEKLKDCNWRTLEEEMTVMDLLKFISDSSEVAGGSYMRPNDSVERFYSRIDTEIYCLKNGISWWERLGFDAHISRTESVGYLSSYCLEAIAKLNILRKICKRLEPLVREKLDKSREEHDEESMQQLQKHNPGDEETSESGLEFYSYLMLN